MVSSNALKNPAGECLDFTFHPAPRRDTLVILGHGLTGDKDRPLLVALADGLSERGWPCMRISFAGNGGSQGRFEDSTITKQVSDLKALLANVPDYVRVVYVGHSMGSAVGVLTAASDLRIRLLISLAGMAHTADFIEREFADLMPGSDCMWAEPEHPLSEAFVDDMKMIGSILPAAATVTQPWLLIHGTTDDVIPADEGRDLHAAAVCRKKWLEIDGAGHSLEGAYPQMIDEVAGWMTANLG
jgi:pimeloyl-ACP methyl ester carboxylesterase